MHIHINVPGQTLFILAAIIIISHKLTCIFVCNCTLLPCGLVGLHIKKVYSNKITLDVLKIFENEQKLYLSIFDCELLGILNSNLLVFIEM